MKKLLILLVSAFLIVSYSTSAQDKNKPYILSEQGVYEEVVEVSGVSQADLFKRAKTWILENMKTDDNNVLFDDKEFSINNNGTLNIDPKTTFMWVIKAGANNFKFHVWSKDGRYKMRVDNVVAHLIVHVKTTIAPRIIPYNELEDNKMGNYVKGEINEKMAVFVNAFKAGMTTAPSQKDSW